MLNYFLLYGFLYSLLSLIFPSKEQEDIIIDFDFKDSEIVAKKNRNNSIHQKWQELAMYQKGD